MRQWFNQLKRQEQLLLSIGAAALISYLIYAVLWQPIASSNDVIARQNEAAKKSLHKVKELAVTYKTLKKNNGDKNRQSGKSLTRLIDESVKKNELEMKRFQPSSSGDVQVRFENAVFNNMVAWLNQLENDHGVFIKDLAVSPGGGSGLVNVSVRLRTGH